MLRLIPFTLLFFTASSEPRSPRIYNVLISSKKNLSPSHAQPVYEPVLRTTSIGYAFPTLFYHSSFIQGVPITYINPGYPEFRRNETPYLIHGKENPQHLLPLPYNQNSQSLDIQKNAATGRSDSYALNFPTYLPNNPSGIEKISDGLQQQEDDPKTVVANLRKNSEIPDVPPPPLPVKTSSS